MKPVTQILRAFIEPDPPKPRKPRKSRAGAVSLGSTEPLPSPSPNPFPSPPEAASEHVSAIRDPIPNPAEGLTDQSVQGEHEQEVVAEDAEDDEVCLTLVELAALEMALDEERSRVSIGTDPDGSPAAATLDEDAEEEEICLTAEQMAALADGGDILLPGLGGDPDWQASEGDSAYARQKADMEKIQSLLGPNASPWFGPTLTLDCETTTGIGQKLRFGVYQDRGHNYCTLITLARQPSGKAKLTRAFLDELQNEGIFYEPRNCTKQEIETMRAYARANDMRFMTKEQFLYKVFYKLSYIKGKAKGIPDDTLPRLIIGHNLPFDLGAMSSKTSPSRKRNYGGLTLTFAPKRPGISVKKIGFGKHLFECGYSVNGRRTLNFLDTMQLGRALLGPGGSGLEKMAARLGISDVEGKGEPDLSGPIDE